MIQSVKKNTYNKTSMLEDSSQTVTLWLNWLVVTFDLKDRNYLFRREHLVFVLLSDIEILWGHHKA